MPILWHRRIRYINEYYDTETNEIRRLIYENETKHTPQSEITIRDYKRIGLITEDEAKYYSYYSYRDNRQHSEANSEADKRLQNGEGSASETGENERFSVADSPISEDDLDNALLQDVEHEETLRKLADFAKKFGVNWNLSEDGTQILDNKTKQSPTAS